MKIALITRMAVGSAAALSLLAVAAPASAADDDACAIWICLPAGFAVPECSKSYSAMVKRLVRGKSPLPLFTSCFGSDGGTGKQRHRTRRGPICEPGFDLEGGLEDWEYGFNDFHRRDQDFLPPYQCRNTQTGQSYTDRRIYTIDDITLTFTSLDEEGNEVVSTYRNESKR